MGVRQQAPVPVFPRPPDQYEFEEESQFRLSVERAVQEVIGYLTDARTGTPAALGVGDNNNYAIGVSDFLRLSANGGGSAITGLDSGRSGRRLVIVNLVNTLTLEHEDAASTAENRIITATGAAISLAANDMAELIYDEISARWRVKSTAV
ncbi:MAG: hypothetical protein V3S55_10170 [Nitrospiraceae bacterium]